MIYNNNWKPITEYGNNDYSEFDKRFKIDRTFTFKSFLRRHRIRFVQYPDDEKITVRIISMLNLPKIYWKYTEKRMKHLLPFNLVFKTKELVMTPMDIYNNFQYNITWQHKN